MIFVHAWSIYRESRGRSKRGLYLHNIKTIIFPMYVFAQTRTIDIETNGFK